MKLGYRKSLQNSSTFSRSKTLRQAGDWQLNPVFQERMVRSNVYDMTQLVLDLESFRGCQYLKKPSKYQMKPDITLNIAIHSDNSICKHVSLTFFEHATLYELELFLALNLIIAVFIRVCKEGSKVYEKPSVCH